MTVLDAPSRPIEVEFYSIIYTAEWDPRKDMLYESIVADFAPPQMKRGKSKLWQMTEGDEQADGGEFGMTRHRKWVALLTPDQTGEWADCCGMIPTDTVTMGSLGAPGFGFGWAPAMAWECDTKYSSWVQAYVTPILVGDPADYEPILAHGDYVPGDGDGIPVPLDGMEPSEADIAAAWDRLWNRTVKHVIKEFYS